MPHIRTSKMRRSRRWWSTNCAAPCRLAAVKAPGFGDRRKAMLKHIAILTGAKLIAEEMGIKLETVALQGTRARQAHHHRQRRHHPDRRRWKQGGHPRPREAASHANRGNHLGLRPREAAEAREARRRRGGDQRRRGHRARAAVIRFYCSP